MSSLPAVLDEPAIARAKRGLVLIAEIIEWGITDSAEVAGRAGMYRSPVEQILACVRAFVARRSA